MTDPTEASPDPGSCDLPGGTSMPETRGDPAHPTTPASLLGLELEILLVLGATILTATVESLISLAYLLRERDHPAPRSLGPDALAEVTTWLPSTAASCAWMCVIALVVMRSGQSPRSFGLVKRPRPSDIVVALTLYFAHLGAIQIVPVAVDAFADVARWPVLLHGWPARSTVAGHSVFAVAMISNGIAEELVMRCYLVTRLERYLGSTVLAVVVSSCIGALYHLYQGPLGALIVLCSSLLFGAVFVLRRSIWPVAAAHVALDLLLV